MDAVSAALLEEVKALKERVEALEKVLEKVATAYTSDCFKGGDGRYMPIVNMVLLRRGGK